MITAPLDAVETITVMSDGEQEVQVVDLQEKDTAQNNPKKQSTKEEVLRIDCEIAKIPRSSYRFYSDKSGERLFIQYLEKENAPLKELFEEQQQGLVVLLEEEVEEEDVEDTEKAIEPLAIPPIAELDEVSWPYELLDLTNYLQDPVSRNIVPFLGVMRDSLHIPLSEFPTRRGDFQRQLASKKQKKHKESKKGREKKVQALDLESLPPELIKQLYERMYPKKDEQEANVPPSSAIAE